MNMERRLTCKYCRQTAYVLSSAHHIYCFGCKAVLLVSDSNDAVNHSRVPPSTSDTNVVRSKGIPPSAQHISCLRCEIDYSEGNTRDNYVQIYRETTGLCLDFSKKKKTVAKHIYQTLIKRLPFSNDQQAVTTSLPHICTMHPPPRGRRALLCGVSYKKQKYELKGVVQDVKNIKQLLIDYYDFPAESILILAEEESYHQPKRVNIEEAFQWLVRGIQPGDSLVFYFSGHGKRQRDYNRDDIDGFDETICPLDFETNGMIVDNYIHEAIVRPLIRDVTLHAIIDSCHSGIVLDLQCVYNITRRKWEDNGPPSGVPKGTSGGKAICFSACEDYQLAADTSASSEDKEITGAMTTTFINVVTKSIIRNESITYQGIMDSIHHSIKQASKSEGFFAGIRRIFHRRILLDPQLSSSEEFNTSTVFKL